MQRKSPLVTEHIECLAVGVLLGGGVVLALIEEGAGLLAVQGVVVKPYTVHGEDGARLLALEELGVARWKIFQFADSGLDTFEDAIGFEFINQGGQHDFADVCRVHRLR